MFHSSTSCSTCGVSDTPSSTITSSTDVDEERRRSAIVPTTIKTAKPIAAIKGNLSGSVANAIAWKTILSSTGAAVTSMINISEEIPPSLSVTTTVISFSTPTPPGFPDSKTV